MPIKLRAQCPSQRALALCDSGVGVMGAKENTQHSITPILQHLRFELESLLSWGFKRLA